LSSKSRWGSARRQTSLTVAFREDGTIGGWFPV
jgi:hypothetical protein